MLIVWPIQISIASKPGSKMHKTSVKIILLLILCIAEPPKVKAANGALQQDRVAIEQSIQAQINAFQDQDAMRAFAFAAPNIQKKFLTPERFLRMVEPAYPALHNPRSLRFGALTFQYHRGFQKIHLVKANVLLLISLSTPMIKLETGLWRIEGVTLIRGKEQAT